MCGRCGETSNAALIKLGGVTCRASGDLKATDEWRWRTDVGSQPFVPPAALLQASRNADMHFLLPPSLHPFLLSFFSLSVCSQLQAHTDTHTHTHGSHPFLIFLPHTTNKGFHWSTIKSALWWAHQPGLCGAMTPSTSVCRRHKGWGVVGGLQCGEKVLRCRNLGQE